LTAREPYYDHVSISRDIIYGQITRLTRIDLDVDTINCISVIPDEGWFNIQLVIQDITRIFGGPTKWVRGGRDRPSRYRNKAIYLYYSAFAGLPDVRDQSRHDIDVQYLQYSVGKEAIAF
jgi:hypothetical protein